MVVGGERGRNPPLVTSSVGEGDMIGRDLRGYFEGQLQERLGVPVRVLDQGMFWLVVGMKGGLIAQWRVRKVKGRTGAWALAARLEQGWHTKEQ